MISRKHFTAAGMVLAGLLTAAPSVFGQAQVTGTIQGLVTDPAGAILPKATIELQNLGTGASQAGRVDSQGMYHFALLPPGNYSLKVGAPGFQTQAALATVAVGQVTTSNFKLGVATSAQTVEVNGAAPPLVETESANTSSTLQQQEVENLPVPGSDINYLALLAPGAIMVGGSSFPAVYGVSTSSNMYTVNGMEDIDPWNNGTNGGASNLLLGLNEVQESTEVSNGFTGQYGTLAGSNVNMVTKSGTNKFHGDLIYNWAGRATEANDFLFNAKRESRPFVNANQWAGSIGGPIWKNKLFLFVDNEGIALVLPGSAVPVLVPTQQFETATLANLAAKGQSAQVPFYQSMFNLWNSAPGAATAAPTPGGGCGTFAALGAAAPCSNEFYSAQTNTSHEIVTTFRIDYNLGKNDHAYFHYLMDRGVQDTGVDPINPDFDAISRQPEFNGQFSETHTFSTGAVNQFQAAGQNYKALFGPADLAAALQVFPTTLTFGDGSFTNLGGNDNTYPEGRDMTRYQFSDDFSKLWGRHTFQTGVYFSRYDATDFQFGEGTSGLLTAETLDAFYNGGYDPTPGDTGDITTYTQSFPLSLQQPLAMYRLGYYAQDEWRAARSLSLTLSLRADHASNPVCQTACFADTAGFLVIPHSGGIPYNQSISTGLTTGLPELQAIEWQPRIGFAWTPFGSGTSLRGGFGLFSDNFPLDTITGFATNPPEDPSFTATRGALAPTAGNSLESQAAADYKAMYNGFGNGATLATLQAAVPGFVPPNLVSSDPDMKDPTYYKWNLDLQHALSRNVALDVGCNGNHGVHELIENQNVNAFDPAGFIGLPTAPVDPRFLEVADYEAQGISNYNGMTATLNDRLKTGMVQVSYTWSHALDDGVGTGQTKTTQYPTDMLLGYGDSDFDYRQYASATWVWNVPFDSWWGGARGLTRGWQFTGNAIVRSGAPVYVYNTNGTLSADGYGGRTLANYLGGVTGNCSSPAVPCFTAAEFSKATTGFSTTQSRDMFRGPGFWDSNMSLARTVAIPGWENSQLELAANGYNVFNHPNFAVPGENLSSAATFGIITSMQTVSSSPLGSNGADTSPRIFQGRITLRW